MTSSGIPRVGYRVRARNVIPTPTCPVCRHVTQRHGLNHRRCPECKRMWAVEMVKP